MLRTTRTSAVKIMSRYSFFNARPQINEEKIAKAQVITDLKRELELTAASEQYNYKQDDALTKLFNTATAVEIKNTMLNNGNEVNRVVVTMPNGKRFYNIRVFGTDKELIPEKKFSSEEIKKLSFGYCTSGDETITDGVIDRKTGEYVLVRRKYLSLS